MRRPVWNAEAGLFSVDEPIEKSFQDGRTCHVVGVDEAGRGPLAGPVVAAAVLFKDVSVLWSCRDSKALSAQRRSELSIAIKAELQYGIGSCDHHEIDQLNILAASLEAMRRAIAQLDTVPDIVLVDGNRPLTGTWQSYAIVKGDARVHTIAAASILAKVARDEWMTAASRDYPEYGFDIHFGYPTAAHRAVLKRLGPCSIHRKSFRGVHELVAAPSE